MNDKKKLKNYDDLPLVLDVDDVRRIMGISRTSAYELVRTPGFPAFRSGRLIKVRLDGKRKPGGGQRALHHTLTTIYFKEVQTL